jgi:hypothetical protein
MTMAKLKYTMDLSTILSKTWYTVYQIFRKFCIRILDNLPYPVVCVALNMPLL